MVSLSPSLSSSCMLGTLPNSPWCSNQTINFIVSWMNVWMTDVFQVCCLLRKCVCVYTIPILSGLDTELQRLDDVRNRRLQLLRQADRDTYNAVQWLRSNRDRFKQEVYEPVVLVVSTTTKSNLCTVRILPYLVRKTALSTEVRGDTSKYGKTHNLQYDFVYSRRVLDLRRGRSAQ